MNAHRSADFDHPTRLRNVTLRTAYATTSYRSGDDFISLPRFRDFKSAAHFYGTAFHELGHCTGHPARLDRDLRHRFRQWKARSSAQRRAQGWRQGLAMETIRKRVETIALLSYQVTQGPASRRFLKGAGSMASFEPMMKFRDPDTETSVPGEPPLPAISANTLARFIGVSPKVIYDLAKAGVIERGPGRLFPLEDSVRRYCEYIRRQADGSP
jgi:hypothetical protein